MSETTITPWKKMRTKESRLVEEALRKVFDTVDAYRYNSASIRVRVIDPRFEGKTHTQRDTMVERHLKKLPPEIQADIMNLLTLAPSEKSISTSNSISKSLANLEFEDPGESML